MPCKVALSLAALLVLQPCIAAEPESAVDLAALEQQLEKFDKVSIHPSLLPLILRNKDFIGLSADQEAALVAWRTDNYRPMVDAMNEIIRTRAAFEEAVLSPDISAQELRTIQQKVFDLESRVLEHKLACRENMLRVFNAENWENFFIVMADEGYAIPSEEHRTRIARLTGVRP